MALASGLASWSNEHTDFSSAAECSAPRRPAASILKNSPGSPGGSTPSFPTATTQPAHRGGQGGRLPRRSVSLLQMTPMTPPEAAAIPAMKVTGTQGVPRTSAQVSNPMPRRPPPKQQSEISVTVMQRFALHRALLQNSAAPPAAGSYRSRIRRSMTYGADNFSTQDVSAVLATALRSQLQSGGATYQSRQVSRRQRFNDLMASGLRSRSRLSQSSSHLFETSPGSIDGAADADEVFSDDDDDDGCFSSGLHLSHASNMSSQRLSILGEFNGVSPSGSSFRREARATGRMLGLLPHRISEEFGSHV